MTKNINLNTNMSQISFSMILLGLLAVAFTLMADYLIFSSETENDAFATTSRRSSISIEQANALPLTNAEGNQVKVVINYNIMDPTLLGERINAIMGIYDRETGTLVKISSFPDGFVVNDTQGTAQLATTLVGNPLESISAIVTLTNAEKSEKYSNDVRADLGLRTILPTVLPLVLDENSLTSPSSSLRDEVTEEEGQGDLSDNNNVDADEDDE